MELSDSSWWWLAAALLVAAEMLSGTFYLLMLALGLAAGALAAHAQLGMNMQLIIAALVGGGTVALWHVYRTRRAHSSPSPQDAALSLDVGEHVQVAAWGTDGTAQVSHRGAIWHAAFVGTGTPQPGTYVIQGSSGNRLMLDRLHP